MWSILAWVLVALDVVMACALSFAVGVLAHIFIGSIAASDRRIGWAMLLIGLLLLAHPALGVWWAWRGMVWWALIYSALSLAIGGFLLWLTWRSVEAAARP